MQLKYTLGYQRVLRKWGEICASLVEPSMREVEATRAGTERFYLLSYYIFRQATLIEFYEIVKKPGPNARSSDRNSLDKRPTQHANTISPSMLPREMAPSAGTSSSNAGFKDHGESRLEHSASHLFPTLPSR